MEIEAWRKRDPIARLVKALFKIGQLDKKNLANIENEVALEVENAWAKAITDPYPPLSAITSSVYADGRVMK